MCKQRLGELLRRLASRTSVQHAIIALESTDRSFRWIGARSESTLDANQVQADTPFFLASIDKLYNATVVMKLSEGGLVDLNALLRPTCRAR